MIEELCDRIWAHEKFHTEREELVSAGLQISIGQPTEFSNIEAIQRLLQCALNMAMSDNPLFRKVSYEITISTIKIIENLKNIGIDKLGIAEIASAILDRLGNFPASSFCAQQLNHDLVHIYTPPSLWIENEFHRDENTINITKDQSITFTNFQRKLWLSLEEHKSVTINAPTSAGKSFVLQNYIAKYYANNSANLSVYIVPTRALIGQVINDFHVIAKKFNLDVAITEVPTAPEEGKKHLYVLTQERFQILLDNFEDDIDLLIIDEAQNISDGSRGIILQSVIERVRSRSGNTTILFGCPFTKNPNVFSELFLIETGKNTIVDTEESPVLQNLMYIDTNITQSKEIVISNVFEDGKKTEISKLRFDTELVKEEQSLCQIAYQIGKPHTNIIYGSEPAKCEDLAVILKSIAAEKDLEHLSDNNVDEEVLEFSKFIQQHIHKDFLLADTIKYGVAYHFGKMPSFLRKGIESLCSQGKIPFIICTSTLLQGLNLPAKNIFIMNPTKGVDATTRKAIPLSPSEFWNLAGRAGRLTKDFEGNIFLINLDSWIENPLPQERRQEVEPAFSSYLCKETKNLIDFMSNDKAPSGQRESEGIESAFMKLYNEFQTGKHHEILVRYEDKIGENSRVIEEKLTEISKKITVPPETSRKNPNVSIYRQQDMLDYLLKRIKEKGAEYVIPPHPLRPFEDIKPHYIRLFKRMHTRFIGLPPANNSHIYYSTLALLWMRGVTYSELLQNRIDNNNKTRKRGEANPNTEARRLFEDIENALRFRYVKYTRCYIDLLEHALTITENSDYITSIPPIYLFLELGACSKTMMSLIGLGVSRTTSLVLSEKAPRTDMDTISVKKWLSGMSLNHFELPKVLKDEVKVLLD